MTDESNFRIFKWKLVNDDLVYNIEAKVKRDDFVTLSWFETHGKKEFIDFLLKMGDVEVSFGVNRVKEEEDGTCPDHE